MELLRRLIVQEEGQDIVEYALMIGVIVITIWLAISFSGIEDTLSNIWSAVGSALTGAGT